MNVPRVYAYCTNGNLFGLSFLIVEHIVLGQRLSDVYESLNQRTRLRLAHECAALLAEISLHELPKIGCLRSGVKPPINGVRFPTLREPPRSTGIYVGPLDPIVSEEERADLPEDFPFDNGPFARTEQWLQALVTQQDLMLAHARDAGYLERQEVDSMRTNLRVVLQRAMSVLPRDHYAGRFTLHVSLRLENLRVFDRGPQAGSIAALTNVESAFVGPMWYPIAFPRWLKGVDGEQAEQFRRTFDDTFEKKTTTDKGSLKPIIADPRYRELRQLSMVINNPTPELLEGTVTHLARQHLIRLAPAPPAPAPPAKTAPPRPKTPVSSAGRQSQQTNPGQARAIFRPSTPKLTPQERAKALKGGYATDAPAKKPKGDGWQLFKKTKHDV